MAGGGSEADTKVGCCLKEVRKRREREGTYKILLESEESLLNHATFIHIRWFLRNFHTFNGSEHVSVMILFMKVSSTHAIYIFA